MADNFFMSSSLGRIGYALPKPYSASTTYSLRDVVTYGGNAYVVLKDGIKGVVPTADGVNYNLLVERGEAGASNAKIWTGTAVTGTGTGIVATVTGSAAGDLYINTSTGNVYQASAASKWAYKCNMFAGGASFAGWKLLTPTTFSWAVTTEVPNPTCELSDAATNYKMLVVVNGKRAAGILPTSAGGQNFASMSFYEGGLCTDVYKIQTSGTTLTLMDARETKDGVLQAAARPIIAIYGLG